jgi:hypothetical protein
MLRLIQTVLLCGALASACGPAPQPTGPVPVAETPSALDPNDEWDRRVAAWLAAAITSSLDCPMSILEAREVLAADRRRRSIDQLVENLACLCDVRPFAGQVLYVGACTLQNNQVPPYRYERIDRRELAADERQLVAWQHRLAARISGGALPADLLRTSSLDAQLAALADVQAAGGDRSLQTWRDVELGFERLESDAKGGYACLLAGDLDRLEKDLAHHERVDLQGRPSTPGRELVARGKKLVAPHRPKMTACDALERDPEYQQLDAKLDDALERLRRERKDADATRDQANCNGDRDRSALCAAARDVQRLERQIDRIARKHRANK